jgi:hypothetical protein
LEPLLLLRGVREVASLANPATPEAVTQAAFDAARASAAKHPGLPPAKRVTEQLGLRWRAVLEVAHAPVGEQNRLLGVKTRVEEQDWLTEEYVASVLKLVAHRLGKDTLTRLEYDADRQKLLASDRARWLHGDQLLLPKADQIRFAVGSWTNALRIAGLKTPRERGPAAKSVSAPTHAELLDEFWKHYKVLPTKWELIAFARGNGIPYPNEARVAFGKERATWIKARRADGDAVPDEPPPQAERADYSRDVGAAMPDRRRRRVWTDVNDCVAVVKRYLAELPRGKRPNAEEYRAWTQTQSDGGPSPKEFTQHGGWTAILERAQE